MEDPELTGEHIELIRKIPVEVRETLDRHNVDTKEDLIDLTEGDLKELGIKVGDRKKVLRCGQALAELDRQAAPEILDTVSSGDEEVRTPTDPKKFKRAPVPPLPKSDSKASGSSSSNGPKNTMGCFFPPSLAPSSINKASYRVNKPSKPSAPVPSTHSPAHPKAWVDSQAPKRGRVPHSAATLNSRAKAFQQDTWQHYWDARQRRNPMALVVRDNAFAVQ